MSQKRSMLCVNAQAESQETILQKIKEYEKNGGDCVFVYQYENDELARESFILFLRELTECVDIAVCAGCYVNRLEDVKKVYYAGAKKVVLVKEALADEAVIEQADTKFGTESVLVFENVKGALSYLSEGKVQSFEAFTCDVSFAELKTGPDGLVPVIVQDYKTNEVLMLAYMNEEAYNCTICTGTMTYYSRSRNELWIKGATSGHYQYVRALSVDCDSDTLLAKVKQIGAACHTGNRSCFYRDLVKAEWEAEEKSNILEKIYATVMDRKVNPKEGSYTNYLFDKGIDKILKKCGEEATEIVIAAKNPDKSEVRYEIADFLYHVTVLMAECGLNWNDVFSELANRD